MVLANSASNWFWPIAVGQLLVPGALDSVCRADVCEEVGLVQPFIKQQHTFFGPNDFPARQACLGVLSSAFS